MLRLYLDEKVMNKNPGPKDPALVIPRGDFVAKL
jgi:hypothetical protein